MFGPPSSPPAPYTTRQEQEAHIKSSLLPAFGQVNRPTIFKPREFLRSKSPIYCNEDEDDAYCDTTRLQQSAFLPTPLTTSEANSHSSPPPSSPQHEDSYLSEKLAETRSMLGDINFDKPSSTSGPLQQLIIARIPTSGGLVTIGRSSKSSTIALRPLNRLASRIHAKVSFDNVRGLIKIECLGWNGLTVSVPQEIKIGGGRKSYPVQRDQVLNVEKVDGITLEVHGDKVLIELVNDSHASDITDDELWCQINPQEINVPPKKRVRTITPEDVANRENLYHAHLEPLDGKELVADIQEEEMTEEKSDKFIEEETVAAAMKSENNETKVDTTIKETVDERATLHEYQVKEEIERVPTVDSEEDVKEDTFRSSSVEPNEQDQYRSGTRKMRRQHEQLTPESKRELKNVIANFVAFSRLSAVSFTSIRKASSTFQALPKSQMRLLINEIPCIGVITGSVEDTTGRKADDDYYYTAELDDNAARRQMVQKTKGHRSLRNCRKTPKQYLYRPLKKLEKE